MTDIEIARNTKLEPINKIAEKIGITKEEVYEMIKYIKDNHCKVRNINKTWD